MWNLAKLNFLYARIQDPKHGDALYANFRAPLHTWVLFNAASCCAALCRALGEDCSRDLTLCMWRCHVLQQQNGSVKHRASCKQAGVG